MTCQQIVLLVWSFFHIRFAFCYEMIHTALVYTCLNLFWKEMMRTAICLFKFYLLTHAQMPRNKTKLKIYTVFPNQKQESIHSLYFFFKMNEQLRVAAKYFLLNPVFFTSACSHFLLLHLLPNPNTRQCCEWKRFSWISRFSHHSGGVCTGGWGKLLKRVVSGARANWPRAGARAHWALFIPFCSQKTRRALHCQVQRTKALSRSLPGVFPP